MTMTNEPEIVAYMRPAFGEVVSQQEYAGWEHDAFRNPGTDYGNYQRNKTLEYSEPLICLSDYQRLQDEYEKLRKASSELTYWCYYEVGTDVELTPGLKQVMNICGDVYEEE